MSPGAAHGRPARGPSSGEGLRDGTTLQIRAGTLTGEELVGVLVALDAAARADRPRGGRPRRPAWTVAARQEGVGGQLVATRAGLPGRGPGE